MPLQSKSQGRYLNMKFGHDWVKKHHFGGSQKGLPEQAQAGKTNIGAVLFKAQLSKYKSKK